MNFKKYFLLLISLTLVFISPVSSLTAQATVVDSSNPEPIFFSDVPLGNPQYVAIYDLVNKGVLNGFEDGTFKPDQKVTRVELLKMAYNTFRSEYTLTNERDLNCFADIQDSWGKNLICASYEDKIIKGDATDGLFHPDRNVNFAESAKIISLAAYLSIEESTFPWYKNYIKSLDTRFAIPSTVKDFSQELTRGELAEILYRMDSDFMTISKDADFNTFYLPSEGLQSWAYVGDNLLLNEGVYYDENFTEIAKQDDFWKIEDVDCQPNCPLISDNFMLYKANIIPRIDTAEIDFIAENVYIYKNNVFLLSETDEMPVLLENVDALSVKKPEKVRLYFETLATDIINNPHVSADYIVDSENGYLIIQSNLFDGKGSLWREALTNGTGDLPFSRLTKSLAIITIPNPGDNIPQFFGKHHFSVGDKVYYLNMEITGAELASFEVYKDNSKFVWMQKYSHDSNFLYRGSKLVEGADLETFDYWPQTTWYYRDKDHIISTEGEVIMNSDPDSFYLLDNNLYGKDKNNVYLYGEIVENADPETFEENHGCAYDAEKYFMDVLEGYFTKYEEVTLEEWETKGCEKPL